MPQERVPGAGFPILETAVHVTLFEPTFEQGAYNHHPKLAWHDGRLHGMWSNHPHGEDGPGQRVLYASSGDDDAWAEPEELFPRPAPVKLSEETGIALTALKWLRLDGRLFALAECHANIGFTDLNQTTLSPVRDEAHPSRARKGYTPLVREVLPDGACGPIFALYDSLPEEDELEFSVVAASDGSVAELADRLSALYRSPAGLPAWDFEGRLGFPDSIEGNRLCEPTVYQAGDGRHVMLLRDTHYSHRLHISISEDDGLTWPAAQPTDIPDSPSLSDATVLDDGTVLLVGNQMAPEFDRPERRHYSRDPLTVSVSSDGYRFDKVFALRCGTQKLRVPEVRGRGGGGQYPSAVAHGGTLYVLYSMGKEDIALSYVPLSDLQ